MKAIFVHLQIKENCFLSEESKWWNPTNWVLIVHVKDREIYSLLAVLHH